MVLGMASSAFQFTAAINHPAEFEQNTRQISSNENITSKVLRENDERFT
jgi:hypothetical protein